MWSRVRGGGWLECRRVWWRGSGGYYMLEVKWQLTILARIFKRDEFKKKSLAWQASSIAKGKQLVYYRLVSNL